MKTLQAIWYDLAFLGYKSDKGDIHDYISVYEEILAPYRSTAKNVLEIGLFRGDSLLMWEAYFKKADVYGIDCDEQPHGGMADLRPMIATGQHRIYIGDATDEKVIDKFFNGIKFDFICEDAAHDVGQELQIYNTLKPYLNKGALYCIEDVQSIDETRSIFENMDSEKEIEIIDRRHILSRYDDVLVILKDKI